MSEAHERGLSHPHSHLATSPRLPYQVFLMNEIVCAGLYTLGYPMAIVPLMACPLFHVIYFFA